MIAQEYEYACPQQSTVAILSRGRMTNSFSTSQLSLSFIGGLCVGRTSLLLTKEEIVLGRDEGCDLVLEGETISRHHCSILHRGAVYFVRDSSRNGTFVNGARVRQEQLKDGDQIRIGQNLMLIHLSSSITTNVFDRKVTTPHQAPASITLRPQIVVKGLDQGVTQSFSEDIITLGRRDDSDIVIEADNVSRKHLTIERRESGYFVRDLGSANGTYLNEHKVELTQLQDNDRLRIGNSVIAINLVDDDCILVFKKAAK